MEYQAIVIDEPEKLEEITQTQEEKGKKLVELNEASSSQTKDKTFKAHEARPSRENMEIGQGGGEGYGVPGAMESQQQEEQKQDDESFKHSLALITRSLEERREVEPEEGRSRSCCIFRFPSNLRVLGFYDAEPEMVSIGPYHRGKQRLLKFEEYKWSFLKRFLSRTRDQGRDLSIFLREMRALEKRTRDCYSEIVEMSSHDFVEMVLLDGCFVVELLRHLGKSEEVIEKDDPIFSRPWRIPGLMTDLLRLENQLPYFVLKSLFMWSRKEDEAKGNLNILALNVFDLVYPMPSEAIHRCKDLEAKHLLDLFHLSYCHLINGKNSKKEERYRPSPQSMQCVRQLKLSGIKFKSKKVYSFLDIDFHRHVLEIPTLTFNIFSKTVIANCVAFEQRRRDKVKFFTDYVCFMNFLVKEPIDATFLCSDGIIKAFSFNDQQMVWFFDGFANKLKVAFNARDSYLSKQLRDIETYYSSNWGTMMRNYFSSPWSFISVFSAFFVIVLTTIQTVMSILSYRHQLG